MLHPFLMWLHRGFSLPFGRLSAVIRRRDDRPALRCRSGPLVLGRLELTSSPFLGAGRFAGSAGVGAADVPGRSGPVEDHELRVVHHDAARLQAGGGQEHLKPHSHGSGRGLRGEAAFDKLAQRA